MLTQLELNNNGRKMKLTDNYRKNKYCIDCEKKTKGHGLRCRSCDNKLRWSNKKFKERVSLAINKSLQGENAPNFKDGRCLKQYYCVNCNKELSNYQHKRCGSCAMKYLMEIPENCPNYIHGKSKEPYNKIFNDKLKLKIRKRDNFVCQICGMTEEEHITVHGQVLEVHHIDYNKDNCDESNLITLCKQCNVKANFNRDYWYAYFMYIIENK